tara:strand:- start:463 stop:1263 length:801 start_codon:yes stop_codon:yes gene_type:complete
MKKIVEIKIKKDIYNIDLNDFHDLSIPIDIDKKSPSFYDKNPLLINYYKDENNSEWKVKSGAACNIPVIHLNIHCGSTHTECRSHITNEGLTILETINDSFMPSILVSVEPKNNVGNEVYHSQIDNKDSIITKTMLQDKLKSYKKESFKALIVRTLPNLINKSLNKNYNIENNAFFSNDALYYLKSLKIEHLIVDLPSIDKFNDGGSLGNHRIFWNLKESPNYNTITELAFIKNEIKDGFYLFSLNMLNLNLDASPSRPIIYPILK